MQRLKPIIGSFFNAGFLPNAPGTWGSFFALFPIYFVGIYAPWYGIALFTALCSFLTVWVADECERVWGGDPSPLVMDELAGQGMAFIAISFTPDLTTNILILLGGFIAFRFFDIAKPLGVDKLQKLPGGWGILVDDLLAGFYAFIVLKLVLLLIL
ncbi:phosphatidylglycerophosphatase A [Aliifodinibius sp. S!AR15-10]|uniref:phosphatidylglycerophosphatase A family protein n=1 Tax=Aliifodinibius sp. S!AR15-10 TaxID=2950437 RepID=UPI00285FBD3B|nr:phosphatidylglycerophosphatase A [Aliifodinibius sp. S!AR15-10]MDR8390293.1 phosphatidylglycerophosphatase A [Aliifodinibius sp. S!AR15-10]